MKTSIWYHTSDQQPPKSGYYLSYRGWGMGGKADGDHDHGYVYFDKKKNEWRDYDSGGHYAIVYYWTDATPDEWVDQDPPITKRKKHREDNPALQIAWERVQESIRQYEIVRSLIGDN